MKKELKSNTNHIDCGNPEWWHNWFTVIVMPGFWWRLKFLFKPHDLMFCVGDDEWFTSGFKNQSLWYFGGVPVSQRNRVKP